MRIVLLIIALECVSLSVNAQNSNKRPDTYNYNRGLEELRKENYEEALTYLNKEVESNPKNGYAYSWIAMIRHAQEEYGRVDFLHFLHQKVSLYFNKSSQV